MSEYPNLAPPPSGPTAAVGGGPHGSGGPTPPGATAAAVATRYHYIYMYIYIYIYKYVYHIGISISGGYLDGYSIYVYRERDIYERDASKALLQD